jgi:hypothetical protein
MIDANDNYARENALLAQVEKVKKAQVNTQKKKGGLTDIEPEPNRPILGGITPKISPLGNPIRRYFA